MKKSTRGELGLLPLLIISALAAALTIFAVAFILTLISSLTKDPTSLTGILSLLSLLIAGALFGFIATRIIRDGGALITFISAVITALIMSAVGLIWKGGEVPFDVFLNYAAYLGVVGICAFISQKMQMRKSYRYR